MPTNQPPRDQAIDAQWESFKKPMKGLAALIAIPFLLALAGVFALILYFSLDMLWNSITG